LRAVARKQEYVHVVNDDEKSEMVSELRVNVEVGPKGKKVVAVARAWPGLERGGPSEAAAIEKLQSYLPRYAKVAKLARQGSGFQASSKVKVVERYTGVGSTDFWGISFAFSGFDEKKLTKNELDREIALMKACWRYFDDVRLRVSAEMQKGPRGGGRDRDRIVRHTFAAEQDWGKKLGVAVPKDEVILDDRGVEEFRAAYVKAIRTFHSEGKRARTWPLRYLIRHTAFHTMDHAWEMEDKDLTS
jgi:hypothetical protein